ncbi:MAG: oligoendopeptidase F [Vicinamibacteria bacterium]
MLRPIRWMLLVMLAAVPFTAAQEERDRAKIPDKYKWNLTEIYPSDDAWGKAKDALVAQIPQMAQVKGTLGKSPAALLAALDLQGQLNKQLARLFAYASMSADQDTRESRYQALKQEISQIGTRLASETAFVEPEILKLDRATIDRFLKEEPKLEIYRLNLDDVLRRKAHTGTEGEERIIADAGLVTRAPNDAFTLFANADFPYPTVTLGSGKEVKLDQAAFQALRSSPNREDRKKAFAAFFEAEGAYRRTFGALLAGNIQADIFNMKARKYASAVESSLDANNVPIAVYTSLVDGVNAGLPSFHRYLKLRRRILGLDQLHYYDLYAPLVGSVDTQYTVEEARAMVEKALRPLGADYLAVIGRAFDERWLDLFPNTGKTSGAYSQGAAYDVHPYMLINYNGRFRDVSTLAHELGHTMQSYYSNKTQPYATANYPIFVAEVASTFNEALLVDSVLKDTKDDDTRLKVLGEVLEGIKGTVFRQTQFAEFELRAHQMAEKGEALTGDALDKLYMDITKRYYGHDQGVCVVDPEIAHEWAFIPHFYFNFYVFQYATSFTASAALSEKVLAGDPAATKRYRAFLSAGGSKYPVDLLKDAGVDMTTREPLQLTLAKMDRVMEQIEAILDRQGAKK